MHRGRGSPLEARPLMSFDARESMPKPQIKLPPAVMPHQRFPAPPRHEFQGSPRHMRPRTPPLSVVRHSFEGKGTRPRVLNPETRRHGTVLGESKPRSFAIPPASSPARMNTPQRTANSGAQDSRADAGLSLKDLEKKAMETEISVEFFEKVQGAANSAAAFNFALEFAQTEFIASKGDKGHLYKPGGLGNFICSLCKVRYMSEQKLQGHLDSEAHKELDEVCKLRKEQTRLILAGKLKHPIETNLLKNGVGMIDHHESVLKAEKEMKLDPQKCTLDEYILGIYESIMKPFWPLPKSHFYCRMCNYQEFDSTVDMEKHNLSDDHKKREESYKDAFCLYCQVHVLDRSLMQSHEITEKHILIRRLMDETKQAAIEHWHKTCSLEIPAKYQRKHGKSDVSALTPTETSIASSTSVAVSTVVVGTKRSISAVDSAGPSSPKKVASSQSPPAVKVEPSPQPSAAVRTTPVAKMSTSSNTKATPKPAVVATQIVHTPDEKKSLWFIPISGFLCAACQTYVANEGAFESHVNEKSHKDNVDKFKRILAS